MASRLFSSPILRAAATRPSTLNSVASRRAFQSSNFLLQDAALGSGAGVAMPSVRKPVGAFRGGLLGFLLGTSAAAYGTYYYVLEEYRLNNEMLTEDIYALQAAVTRIHDYVRDLEEKVEKMEKRK